MSNNIEMEGNSETPMVDCSNDESSSPVILNLNSELQDGETDDTTLTNNAGMVTTDPHEEKVKMEGPISMLTDDDGESVNEEVDIPVPSVPVVQENATFLQQDETHDTHNDAVILRQDTERPPENSRDDDHQDNGNSENGSSSDDASSSRSETDAEEDVVIDPQELEQATAAVVEAATRMERSDSVLSRDLDYDDDNDDDTSQSEGDLHRISNTERYIQEASVEFPFPLPHHPSRQSTLSRASFVTSVSEFEENQFLEVSRDVDEALSDVGEPDTSDEHKAGAPVNGVAIPNEALQDSVHVTVTEMLNSCGALPILESELCSIDEDNLPLLMRKRRSLGDAESQRPSFPMQTVPALQVETDQDTLLLHSLFATFCTPPPSRACVSSILAVETKMLASHHWISTRLSSEESVPLPTDALISISGRDKLSVISVLSNHEILLGLPPVFALSLMRILIRLLTNETDQQYDRECLRTCEWSADVPDDAQDTSGEDENIEHQEFQARTHERVRQVRRRRQMMDATRRQRQELLEKSMNGDCAGAMTRQDQIYGVVRFLGGTAWKSIGVVPVSRMLALWSSLIEEPKADYLLGPVSRLIGILGSAAVSTNDLRRILDFLSRPVLSPSSESLTSRERKRLGVDRLLLLRALRTAAYAPSSYGLVKTNPRRFFSFGGGDGLCRNITPLSSWPFKNDFGMALWFRAETFESFESRSNPKLLAIRTEHGGGIEVSLMPLCGKARGAAAVVIVVSVFDSDNRTSGKLTHRVGMKGCALLPRVWYHVAIRHTRSRLKGVFSLASRQQISILLDGKVMLSESLPFPKTELPDSAGEAGSSLFDGLRRQNDRPGGTYAMRVEFASNFEGQAGRLFVFNGNVSDASLKALYGATCSVDKMVRKDSREETKWDSSRAEKAHKSNALGVQITPADADDIVLSSQEAYRVDPVARLRQPEIEVVDLVNDEVPDVTDLPAELSRVAFASKMFLVWDPARIETPVLLDLHAGAHVRIDADSVVPWTVQNARDSIANIGGIQALLPVFHSLLSGDMEQLWSVDESMATKKHCLEQTHMAASLAIVPSLLSMLASFLRKHERNAREFLRCGGVDVIERLLLLNRSIHVEKREQGVIIGSLVEGLATHSGLSYLLVDSVLELRSACSHYTGLETTVYSRILFNFRLWFGNCNQARGASLHPAFLPVLSSIVNANPGKARDCVGVKHLIDMLEEYTTVGDRELPRDSETDLFDRTQFSGLQPNASLTLSERRYVVDVLLGMITQMLLAGTSCKDISPILNWLSYNLGSERDWASADICDNRDNLHREGTRLEVYGCTMKLITILYFVLQTRPIVPGLFEGLTACCEGPHGVVAWILCGLVNSVDDAVRAIGIRCLSVYLDVVAPHADALLPSNSASGETVESDTSVLLAKPRATRAKRLTATISNVGRGLAAIGNSSVLSSIVQSSGSSVKVAYKLLWHFLKAHRSRLGPKTHAALVQLLLDTKGMQYSAAAVNESIVVEDDRIQSGFRFSDDRATALLMEFGSVKGKKLQDNGAANSILRLLRFLDDEMKERWLLDLVGIISTSQSNLNLLLKCPQWQPSLFHLESDVVEEIKVRSTQGDIDRDCQAESSASHCAATSFELDLSRSDRDDRDQSNTKNVHDFQAKAIPRIYVLFELSVKLYSGLLGDCVRRGGDQALRAIEQAASLQRVCVNGHEAFILLLNHLLANLIDYGTLEIKTISTPQVANGDEPNSLLKHSAGVVTRAIVSVGGGDIDVAVAVDQWRCLRHLTSLTAAVVTKSGFGVVQLLDYRNQQASAVDSISGGLHGIRLPDGNVPGMDGSEYIRVLGLSPSTAPSDRSRLERHLEKWVCVAVTAQVLSLLDAFVFPDSLDVSQPASQLHGLALVRTSEPRLGVAQGPLLASLIRLSLVLICYLEPSSLKFLQCCSRLRCFLHWSIELIRESASLSEYSAAFDELSAPLDRLILSVLLQCHRALSRCSVVLMEIEASETCKYFPDEASQKKNYRRLLRVAFELREIVLAIYRGRNEVLRAALSLDALDSLTSALEAGNDSGSKEAVVRSYLSSKWVCGFHDVDLDGDCPIPEMLSTDGSVAIEALAAGSDAITREFHHALDTSFEEYCEDQRQWAETEAVRDLEYDGEATLKNLLGRLQIDRTESTRQRALRSATAKTRWGAIERKVCELWDLSSHWKLAQHTDRLSRRILLIRNRAFSKHEDASYELMLTQDHEKAERGRAERARKKLQEELSEVMRRNSSAFSGQGVLSGDEEDDDDATDSPEVGLESTAHSEVTGDNTGKAGSSILLSNVDEDVTATIEEIVEPNEAIDHDNLSKNDSWARQFIWADTESIVARFEKVAVVSLQTITEGQLLLTTHGLYFRQTSDAVSVMTKEAVKGDLEDEQRSFRWRLSRLAEVHGRRFMLRTQALELFFSDTHELFLNFSGGARDRDRFYAKLRNSCKVPLLWSPKSLNARTVFRRSQLTTQWRKRQISNFEYLVQLNKMAGRTFNDITQYPVFPWILTDYTSDTIDLNDSRVYRDLTKPMGAQNSDRLAQLLERYKDLESFGFAENERFLYGSHYSSPGMVLHFMLRQEPFTSMAVELQSGRFDCPDRLFFDLAGCWNSCLTSTSDVKELIPEFFTLPEMFLNTNGLPLGRTQNDRSIDNVALPPWARGSAYEFVRIHRLALESEYVSRHLDQWIDLIFGYKQRGPEAEKAHNVFHYLSYEGSVDLDKITDDVDRAAAESHIQNFGQTPSQLLVKDPHPRRNSADESWRPLIHDVTVPKHLRCHTPGRQFGGRGLARGAVYCIHAMTESILVVYADLSIGSYKWNPNRRRANGGHHPFSIRMDKHHQVLSRELSTSRAAMKRGSALPLSLKDSKSCHAVGGWSFAFTLGGTVRENLRRKAALPPNRLTAISAKDMLTSSEASSMMVSCGFWDDTIKVHSSDGSKLLASADGGHRGPIRCLALGEDGGLLVTGGEDSTCRVWVVDHPDMASALSDGYVQTALGGSHDRDQMLSCCHVLWGHDTPVVCVALSSDLDVTVSGSVGGVVCVHTIRRGEFIRSFRPSPGFAGVRRLALETHGTIAIHTEDGGLFAYTINGVRLATADVGELLHDLRICGENMIVTGGESGQVVIRTLSDLRICSKLDLHHHGPVRCLSMTPKHLNPLPQYLFIGSDDGMITIVDRDPMSAGKGNDDTAETVTFDRLRTRNGS